MSVGGGEIRIHMFNNSITQNSKTQKLKNFKSNMNIITHTSRAYHKPCEIQSVVIDSSFTACVIMTALVVVVVVIVGITVVTVAAVVVMVEVLLVPVITVVVVRIVAVLEVLVILVVVVVVVTVVGRTLVCAGAVIDTLTVDM